MTVLFDTSTRLQRATSPLWRYRDRHGSVLPSRSHRPAWVRGHLLCLAAYTLDTRTYIEYTDSGRGKKYTTFTTYINARLSRLGLATAGYQCQSDRDERRKLGYRYKKGKWMIRACGFIAATMKTMEALLLRALFCSMRAQATRTHCKGACGWLVEDSMAQVIVCCYSSRVANLGHG
ncbi:hypothetical protein M3J07_013862 [Ascochyta lentis]